MDKNSLAERFINFAVLECTGSSEIYKRLASEIAKDDDLLTLCLEAREGQPIPNLFLGAVHYLLLQGTDHQLKEYYPSIANDPKTDGHLFETFKGFCIENSSKIKSILKNKLVQTNEVRRCAYLFPVFNYVHQQTNRPLSLIEIGTSAGLQLLWDQYSYAYDKKEFFGNKKSYVHLKSTVRKGEIPRDLISSTPPVHDRRGLDLHISDLTSEEDYLWLKSLIWPEHQDRMTNFENAVKQLRLQPPHLIEGDGVGLLTEVVEELPTDTTLCIFHTHVANQIPETVKGSLLQKVNEVGRKRDVFHIYNNIEDRKLHVDSIVKGVNKRETVGETDGHGRWFDWKLSHEV